MKKISSLLVFTSMWFCIGFSAFGDDLDIYVGTSSTAVTYNPNVLFIMDTSGSMTGTDGTGQTRMLRVQNALRQTLAESTNINAGLMRFSDWGGPVLFPIRSIDESITPEIITSTADDADDAYEINGTVTVNNNRLKLSAGTDTVVTGVRYQDLMIPQGATITSAYFRLTTSVYNIAPTTFTISGELSGDADPFTSNTNDISARTQSTNQVLWENDNEFNGSGDVVVSPDFSSVIQEIVDQADWCGGNNLGLFIKGESTDPASNREIRASDDGAGLSPQLVVSYDDTTATGCVSGTAYHQVDANRDNVEEQPSGYDATGSELTMSSSSNSYIGIRFPNVNIPQGATIDRAFIRFTAYTTDAWSSASTLIRAVTQDNIDDFDPHYRYDIRDLPKSGGVNWSMPYFYRNSEYDTPDLTAMVQGLVNRSGWAPGNAMGFVLSNFVGKRGAYTYRGKPSGAPQLIIEYQGNATPGVTSTVRDHLISKVDELTASGFTPIVDTLYEASLYYGGMGVDYGAARGTSSVSSRVRRNTRVSHRASYVGPDAVRPSGCSEDNLSDSDCINEYIPEPATYISPVQNLQCQTNNHIVLLSDGEANNNHSVDEIQALLGQTCGSGRSGEICGLELVRNISKSDTSAIDARVITHTIGFAANSTANNFLNQLAVQSGGGFYQAENSTQLLDAFKTILRSVKDINATFVSPGVAVNQLNRLTHRDELYFALFKPAEGTIWPGNLKKYKIDGDVILDQNGRDAVDSVTGFFSDTSQSYWSILTDGNDVREGGAASLMGTSRNMYFFEGPGAIISSSNQIHESNDEISTTDLAIDSLADATALRSTLLKWARGVDVRDYDGDGDVTDSRMQMGDPIHSQPVVINYSETDSAILVATNHGFLHSFDAETGLENFAIAPKDMLQNVYDFYQDNSTLNHIYGLDGDMVIRNFDDKIYLYLGMRRGGRNYYVFDITSKTSPSLVYSIQGGSTGFEKLGQTWSRPTITKVRMGNTIKDVVIFAGGYDDSQDNKTIRTPDGVGNAVYIVDASTGELLWSASNADADLNIPEMTYSIPGRVSVIDRDNDGFADHMYIADMGGQLFRLDIYNGESGNDFIKGKRLADLGGETAENNRRFFYGPDVSEVALGNELYYAVALGSGWRASPLDEVIDDRFYMLKDKGVFALDENNLWSFETGLTESSFYDATDHLLNSTDSTERELASNAFANKNGWMLRLTIGGEKVLSSPLIIDYKVFFTTYIPASSSESLCAPPSGNSRAYLVNLFNGNAIDDLNQDGFVDEQDRSAQLKQTGIAPDTKILIEEIIQPVVCLGTECVSAVVETDEDGNEVACGSDFECLARNIYGRFERVTKGSWKSETEKE